MQPDDSWRDPFFAGSELGLAYILFADCLSEVYLSMDLFWLLFASYNYIIFLDLDEWRLTNVYTELFFIMGFGWIT